MSGAIQSRGIVLREKSGLFFVGPDAPEPWLDDARRAMRFSCASQAWHYAQDLEISQAELLQGNPLELALYDSDANQTSHLVSTDAEYPVLRAQWREVPGEPLPLDIPRAPQTAEVARTRLSNYLSDANWDAVRARGGDSFGFDPSFWVQADKLFQADKSAFLVLWSAVAPPDIPPPDLASPRWRAALEGADSFEEPNEVVAATPAPAATPAASFASKPAVEPPAYVARHFVESRGAFYYRQRPDVLAFSSRGQSFRARDDSVMTATAIIELARQRGWSSVRVRGSSAFRRAVWTAASERGIQVLGYSPTRGETAVLAQSASPDGHPSRSSRDSKNPASARSSDSSLTGVVVDMGSAPYQHDRANSESFFVTLRDADGQEHTHWGVGLQRAIEKASVARGDRVALERLGKESVEVDRPVLDDKGDVSYKKAQVVERRVWGVRVVDQTREASPGAVDTQTRSGASADPELAKALAMIEKRLPQLPEAARQELRRHFDAAYARLSKSPPTRCTGAGGVFALGFQVRSGAVIFLTPGCRQSQKTEALGWMQKR